VLAHSQLVNPGLVAVPFDAHPHQVADGWLSMVSNGVALQQPSSR